MMEVNDRRRLLWETLSALYLDTELSDIHVVWLRGKIAQSGYSIDQIKQINYNEVAPILYPNLLSMVGEWSGFDPHWLAETISRRGSRLPTLLGSYRLWQWWIDYLVGSDLNRLLT